MKGIVFTEFTAFVEGRAGLDPLDRIIDAAVGESGGAYTALGTYNHREMLGLVDALATETGQTPEALMTAFGEHLFHRFAEMNPAFVAGLDHPFPFLEQVETYIHMEVRKLYPDAELPTIATERPDAATLCVTYRSRRPFAALAHGLVEGCLDHFGAPVTLRAREDLPGEGPGTAARFTLVAEGGG